MAGSCVGLQVRLELGLQKERGIELDDLAFRRFAFRTHAPAYWEAGLHDVPLKDKLKIAATPEGKEWLSFETWKQAGDVAGREASATAGDVGHAVSDVAADVRDYFKEVFR